ncbi:MAG: hypothetical protein WBD47_18425, partial [Phormidesmis sp.]
FCVVKPDQPIGITAFEDAGNGFAKINVAIAPPSCPTFKGEAFAFKKHFSFSTMTKAVAQRNEIGGGHLRRRPVQLSALADGDVCVMKPNRAVGIGSFEDAGNGFVKVNVTAPSSSCPDFKGELFLFGNHFNFE